MFNFHAGSHAEILDLLNGVLKSPLIEGDFPDLDALTLIFAVPSVTVTFSTPADWDDVIDQINTQVQAVSAGFVAKRLIGDSSQQLHFTPALGESLTLQHTGTANGDLGFGEVAPTVVTPIDPSSIFRSGGDGLSTFLIVEGTGALNNFETDHSGGADITGIISAAPATLQEVVFINREGAPIYFQLHDLAGALSGAEVPKVSIPIASGERLSFVPDVPMRFGTGIVFGFSSTQDSYTAASTGGTVYAASHA